MTDAVDFESIVRLILEARVAHYNSWNGAEYDLSLDDAARSIGLAEHEASLVCLFSHWGNDIDTIAEISYGLALEGYDGKPVLYGDGKPMISFGKPLMYDEKYRIITVEKGEEAHALRHGYSLSELEVVAHA